jgi:hypothetical protein
MSSNALVTVVSITTFDSVLVVPTTWSAPDHLNFENYGAPPNNAILTIKLRYKLVFADSKNPVPDVIVRRDGTMKGKDDTGFAHPILEWDEKSRRTFTSAFELGEKIWSRRFLLKTPATYTGFDFGHPDRPGATIHPNVICLFVMSASENAHARITIVRHDRGRDGMPFRTSSRLFDDRVPWTPTLGHELGHLIGLGHIKVLLGDRQCSIEPNEDRCYGETEEERANIMGSGPTLTPLNAAPWIERIAAHTQTIKTDWTATLDLRIKPQIS